MEPKLIDSSIHQDLQYLYALDGKGIKPGLKRVLLFLDRIGNPQKKIRTIHVAGTNGKGSTCAIIASILQAAGYKVGLYTSPHLIRFNERIRVDNEKISDEEIVSFIHNHRSLIDEIDTTFFETTTAMAFDHFRRRKVDIAVLETGLGGRFDATNVVTPLLSVITPIGKDHEEFLGNTLAKITREKAGIIKTGVPCLAARQRPGVKHILKNDARGKSAVFHYAPDLCRVSGVDRQIDRQEVNIKCDELRLNGVTLPLIGDHQVSNLQTAVSAVRLISGFKIQSEAIQKGVKATRWHGRLEILSKQPFVLYDVGHNLQGIRQVASTLEKVMPGRKIKILLTLGQRKIISSLGSILERRADFIYISEIPNGKSVSATKLAKELERSFLPDNIVVNKCFQDFLPEVVNSLSVNDNLLILGSHYIAPAVYKFFKINV